MSRVCVCYFRLQHEVSVLQQQVCESRGLVQSLQCELQVYQRVCGVATNTHSGTIKRLLKPLKCVFAQFEGRDDT